MKKSSIAYLFLGILLFLFTMVDNPSFSYVLENNNSNYDFNEILNYDKTSNYIILNNNVPTFTPDEMSTISFEKYSELDYLGRCGEAFANVSIDTMPTEERKSIGQIKPTGFHTIKYDIVDKGYLYNRCHLIAFQLTGENANKKNLITCTRQMNSEVMVEFENKVAKYIKETNNHVLYRVRPYFENDNLLATGVQIEAKSVEDNGEGISFNVFIYNIQDGIEIDYKTGDSKLASK